MGVRMQKTNGTAVVCGQVVQAFHRALRGTQDELAVGTGAE